MTTQKHIALSKRVALISFLVGTAILASYYLTSAYELLFVGFAFITFAGITNALALITLLRKARKDEDNRSRLLSASAVLLGNIPIAIFYWWIIVVLLGTMRITFTNGLGDEITDLNIIGCGGGHIEQLHPGESRTVWVPITGDCSIAIEYMLDGQSNQEVVASYITLNMGQTLNHKIDGRDKDIL